MSEVPGESTTSAEPPPAADVPGTTPAEASPSEAAAKPDPSAKPPFTHTRTSGYWAAVVVGLLVMLVLIVFILENGQRARVSFFGAHGNLPEGVALLLAAVIGGLFVVLAGAARILQLRARSARPARAATAAAHKAKKLRKSRSRSAPAAG